MTRSALMLARSRSCGRGRSGPVRCSPGYPAHDAHSWVDSSRLSHQIMPASRARHVHADSSVVRGPSEAARAVHGGLSGEEACPDAIAVGVGGGVVLRRAALRCLHEDEVDPLALPCRWVLERREGHVVATGSAVETRGGVAFGVPGGEMGVDPAPLDEPLIPRISRRDVEVTHVEADRLLRPDLVAEGL